jgi:hypothetical protein
MNAALCLPSTTQVGVQLLLSPVGTKLRYTAPNGGVVEKDGVEGPALPLEARLD